jgi:hypothetical protein
MPPDLLRFFTSQGREESLKLGLLGRNAHQRCAVCRRAATWGWLSEKSERLVVVILGVSYRSKKTQDLTRCPKLFRVEQRIDERPPGEERANEG